MFGSTVVFFLLFFFQAPKLTSLSVQTFQNMVPNDKYTVTYIICMYTYIYICMYIYNMSICIYNKTINPDKAGHSESLWAPWVPTFPPHLDMANQEDIPRRPSEASSRLAPLRWKYSRPVNPSGVIGLVG